MERQKGENAEKGADEDVEVKDWEEKDADESQEDGDEEQIGLARRAIVDSLRAGLQRQAEQEVERRDEQRSSRSEDNFVDRNLESEANTRPIPFIHSAIPRPALYFSSRAWLSLMFRSCLLPVINCCSPRMCLPTPFRSTLPRSWEDRSENDDACESREDELHDDDDDDDDDAMDSGNAATSRTKGTQCRLLPCASVIALVLLVAAATCRFVARSNADVQAFLKEIGYQHLNETDGRGRTALHHAALQENAASARLLMEHLSLDEVNAKANDGGTALHVAAAFGSTETAKELMQHARFTQANAKDSKQRTALHSAAVHGSTKVVSVLLQHNRFTQANAEDHGGHTAEQLAMSAGHTEIVNAIANA